MGHVEKARMEDRHRGHSSLKLRQNESRAPSGAGRLENQCGGVGNAEPKVTDIAIKAGQSRQVISKSLTSHKVSLKFGPNKRKGDLALFTEQYISSSSEKSVTMFQIWW